LKSAIIVFIKEAKDLVLFSGISGRETSRSLQRRMIGKNDYDFFPKTRLIFTTKDRESSKVTLGEIEEEPIQTRHQRNPPVANEEGAAF